MQDSEGTKIRKEMATLTNSDFQTKNTSLLQFHFEPYSFQSPLKHLENCRIQHTQINGKDLYIFDDFFGKHEGEEARRYSETATFSKTIYADKNSQEKGEEPARAMDNKEKWQFFIKPPEVINELYRLLSLIGKECAADISTLPWDLSDGHITASAIATNRIERLNAESMRLGAHEDYNTEKGLPFGIPVLYGKEREFFPKAFVNGAIGKPWLVSLMFYATAENFKPEFGLGTVFFKEKDKVATQSECRHMNFVLFEGDIVHGIQESTIPEEVKTWRVSYVFKLLMNPLNEGESLKAKFKEWLKNYKIEEK